MGSWCRVVRWAGPTAVVVPWMVMAVAIAANPTFSFAHGALSDLGGSGARRPWVYNDGMVLTGALLILYATHLVAAAGHRVGVVGAALFGVAGQFLILVGLYPLGTPPHNFVSLWFFVESALAVGTWGAAEALSGRPAMTVAYGVLGVGGFVLGVLGPFSSVAWRETFGALCIDAFGLLSFWETGRRPTAAGVTAPSTRRR